jgi:hypothetical protein
VILSEVEQRKQSHLAPAVASIFEQAGNYTKAIYFLSANDMIGLTQSSTEAKPYLLMGLHDQVGDGKRYSVIMQKNGGNPSGVNYIKESMPSSITPEDIVNIVRESIERPETSPRMQFNGPGKATSYLKALQENTALNPGMSPAQIIGRTRDEVGMSNLDGLARSVDKVDAPRPSLRPS